MRKSVYRKAAALSRVLTIIIGAAIVFAQPENWLLTTLGFALLVPAQWWSLRVNENYIDRAGGFAPENDAYDKKRRDKPV